MQTIVICYSIFKRRKLLHIFLQVLHAYKYIFMLQRRRKHKKYLTQHSRSKFIIVICCNNRFKNTSVKQTFLIYISHCYCNAIRIIPINFYNTFKHKWILLIAGSKKSLQCSRQSAENRNVPETQIKADLK